MASGIFFQFDARNHTVVVLPTLGTSLAIRKGSTVEVVLARCHYCSSKVCLSFGPNERRSLQQKQLPKNYIQLWDSQLPMTSSELVPNGDCVVQKSEAAKL